MISISIVFYSSHTFQVDCQALGIHLVSVVHLHHLNSKVCRVFAWKLVSSRQKTILKTNWLFDVDSVAIFYGKTPFSSLLLRIYDTNNHLLIFKLYWNCFDRFNYLMLIFCNHCGISLSFFDKIKIINFQL